MPQIPAPPSSITGPVGAYFQVLFRALDGIPTISKFSGDSPNSLVSGYPGDLAVNLTSATTTVRLWQLGGSVRQLSTTGWNPV